MRKRPRSPVGLLQTTGDEAGESAPECSVPNLQDATAHERRPRAGSPGAETPPALDPSKAHPAGFSDRSPLVPTGGSSPACRRTAATSSSWLRHPWSTELLDLTGLPADVQVEPLLRRVTRAWPLGPQPVDAAGSGALVGRFQ